MDGFSEYMQSLDDPAVRPTYDLSNPTITKIFRRPPSPGPKTSHQSKGTENKPETEKTGKIDSDSSHKRKSEDGSMKPGASAKKRLMTGESSGPLSSSKIKSVFKDKALKSDKKRHRIKASDNAKTDKGKHKSHLKDIAHGHHKPANASKSPERTFLEAKKKSSSSGKSVKKHHKHFRRNSKTKLDKDGAKSCTKAKTSNHHSECVKSFAEKTEEKQSKVSTTNDSDKQHSKILSCSATSPAKTDQNIPVTMKNSDPITSNAPIDPLPPYSPATMTASTTTDPLYPDIAEATDCNSNKINEPQVFLTKINVVSFSSPATNNCKRDVDRNVKLEPFFGDEPAKFWATDKMIEISQSPPCHHSEDIDFLEQHKDKLPSNSVIHHADTGLSNLTSDDSEQPLNLVISEVKSVFSFDYQQSSDKAIEPGHAQIVWPTFLSDSQVQVLIDHFSNQQQFYCLNEGCGVKTSNRLLTIHKRMCVHQPRFNVGERQNGARGCVSLSKARHSNAWVPFNKSFANHIFSIRALRGKKFEINVDPFVQFKRRQKGAVRIKGTPAKLPKTPFRVRLSVIELGYKEVVDCLLFPSQPQQINMKDFGDHVNVLSYLIVKMKDK